MEQKRYTTCTLTSLKYAICDNQNEVLKDLAKVSVLNDIPPICGYEKAPEKNGNPKYSQVTGSSLHFLQTGFVYTIFEGFRNQNMN